MSSISIAERPSSTSYLTQFDAASDADKFLLVRRWIDNEPLSFFAELRADRPVLVTPVCTLVTRLQDVLEVLSQPKIFTVELYRPKMKDYLMTHDDDALHTREKSIMRGLLNRDDLPQVRAMVAGISQDILNTAKGHIESVHEYCRMVPARLVQEYFGLDGIDPRKLIEWSYWNQYDAFHNCPFDLISDELRQHISTRQAEVTDEFKQYLTRLIARKLLLVKLPYVLLWPVRQIGKLLRLLRGKTPYELTDNIVARMLRSSYPDAMEFDIQRLGLNAGGLLIGAVETTSQAVAQAMQFLLNNRQLLAKAADAARRSDPKELDGIVWEVLRFVPISSFLFRKTAQDYTVGKNAPYQTTIPSGTIVLAVTQSAMFDSTALDRPDEFIPERDWYHHFLFGFGSHECLGKYIGMVMIPEMVRQLLLRPGIKADGPLDYKSGPFPEQYPLSWSTNV